MQKLAEVCVKRPVFAVMLIMALVVVGIVSYGRLGIDRFPDVDLPIVSVRTTLLGASPEEIESTVTRRIEDAVATVEGIEDIRGRTLAFTDPNSTSGFKAPSALLRSEFKMVAGKDYKTAFSGKHDNSVIGVVNKDYDAAAIANSVMKRMIRRKVVDGSLIRTIYKSQTFPTTGYGHVYNLNPELAAKVREAFMSFQWAGTALEKEFGKGQPPRETFTPITYKQHWEIVRKIDAASGVTYKCR